MGVLEAVAKPDAPLRAITDVSSSVLGSAGEQKIVAGSLGPSVLEIRRICGLKPQLAAAFDLSVEARREFFRLCPPPIFKGCQEAL